MMNATLLEQFLTEECISSVRDMLRTALDAGNAAPRKPFEFNRFEVNVEVEDGVVRIEYVLDPTDAGAQRVPIGEFSKALNKQPG